MEEASALRSFADLVPPSFSRATSSQAYSDNMGLGGDLDIAALYSHRQKLAIQYAAIATSAVSVLTCLISLYWFTLMRRNFRRTLILLLIISDLFKSAWYLIFPAVSVAVGGIPSYSPFCNVGGFFLQAGVESCDVAILFMAGHMALQIFHSDSKIFGADGLYRFRYAVYATWIILPAFMAALAFVRAGGAYLSQGAFCTLPIRPFWYRLALSWIPRYLIWAYITWIAVRVYSRVGKGFTVFARQVDSRSNPTDDSQMSAAHIRALRGPDAGAAALELTDANPKVSVFTNKSPFDKKISDATTVVAEPSQASSSTSSQRHTSDTLATQTSGLVRIPSAEAVTARSRRAAILRQTRLLFIYPCAYMILMVMPFVQHCFNYSDHYAQHPIFAITLLGTLCNTTMGAIDAFIFCWREKPWRAIPGRDGTVLGSLWPSERGTRARRHTVRLFSGIKSDRNAMAAEYAAERLAMERAAAAEGRTPGAETAGRKDWFDRRESFMEESAVNTPAYTPQLTAVATPVLPQLREE